MKNFRRLAAILLVGISAATDGYAQGFAAVVSPPRFELSASPGRSLRNVIEITNPSPTPLRLNVRTADWSLDKDYTVDFMDALQPGSCRPWVAIERKELSIPGGGRLRYRFEVTPPPDAPVGECRFALLLEGDDQEVKTASGVSFPVSGRIGVIVYVAVGNAAPALEIVKSDTAVIDGRRVPVVHFRNTGNAHGRLAGFLSGVDAKGRSLEFTPSTFPVLPGETRPVSLSATLSRDEAADVAYPVTIRGTFEWANQRTPFEHRFE